MSVSIAELRRGRIAWALFPFVGDFPLAYLEDGVEHTLDTIESYAAARRGRTTKVVTEVRLRPVLLLHDGMRGEYPTVVALRLNSVKPRHRRDPETWRRITAQEHPLFFHLPAETARYQLPEDSVIALSAIGAVSKDAILDVRGTLSDRDMQLISDRLVRLLSLDLARHVTARSLELLRRAGIVRED